MNLIKRVEEAMADDDEDTDKQSEMLEEAYQNADANGKALIDEVFICLCGWSLQTLLGTEHSSPKGRMHK